MTPKRRVRRLRRDLKRVLSTTYRIAAQSTSKDELERFLSRVRASYVPMNLIRLGGERDGGYLTPDVFDTITHCFSPGVDVTARFEAELSERYQITSFMADASVEAAPQSDPNFVFDKKFLGNRTEGNVITLSDWMDAKVSEDQAGLFLQMDIEGGEYEVLVVEPLSVLSRFSVMIIEFHDLGNLADAQFLRLFSSLFEKLDGAFSIAHIHPNNCCGNAVVHGVDIPRVMEVTFVRKDVVEQFRSDAPVSLPHALDGPNVRGREDLVLADVWWRADAT